MTPSISLTSVYLVPSLHLVSLSTPFWPYDTDPFFPYAQIISILTDPLYSPTPFLFQLSYAPLHSQLYPFATLQPNFSRTFTFLLSALLIPHESDPYTAVGTITPSYRHFLAFIPNPLLLSTLFSAPHALSGPRFRALVVITWRGVGCCYMMRLG